MQLTLALTLTSVVVLASLKTSHGFQLNRLQCRSAINGLRSLSVPTKANTNANAIRMTIDDNAESHFDSLPSSGSPALDRFTSKDLTAVTTVLAAVLSAVVLLPMDAFAKDGAYGILEGRTASMLHPVTMLLLFGTSAYAGVLGLKWRQLRGLGEQLKELNKQLPVLSTGKLAVPTTDLKATINQELVSLQGAEDNDAPLRLEVLRKDLSLIAGAGGLESQIIDLQNTRKTLQGANLKDKHALTGSILLGVGVSVSILGAFNTYMRAGKLFPGPHLYAGMGITMLWAAAAALVPEMQKGNEAARVGHIVLNTANVALFAWQVVTGLDIMFKVWGFTHWP